MSSNEFEVRQFFSVIWRGRIVLIIMTALACLLSVTVSLVLPEIYQSESVVAPNERLNSGGMAGLASQYSGIASLAGIDLSSSGVDRIEIGLAKWRSRQFVLDFVERHSLLIPLMAAQAWDKDTNQLVFDDEVYDAESKSWREGKAGARSTKPLTSEIYEKFLDSFSITQLQQSGLYSIKVEHYSPYVAAEWNELLIDDINQQLMQEDVVRAQDAIEYLRKQMDETSITELRSIFSRLIEEHLKTAMLATVDAEYLFRVVDPPHVPDEHSSPQRLLIIVVTTLFGTFLGLFTILFRHMLNADK